MESDFLPPAGESEQQSHWRWHKYLVIGSLVAGGVILMLSFGPALMDWLLASWVHGRFYDSFKTFEIPDKLADAFSILCIPALLFLGRFLLSSLRPFGRGRLKVWAVGCVCLSAWLIASYFLSLPKEGEYFSSRTGEARRKYARNPDGRIRLVEMWRNHDPHYQAPLQKITPEIVMEYERQQASAEYDPFRLRLRVHELEQDAKVLRDKATAQEKLLEGFGQQETRYKQERQNDRKQTDRLERQVQQFMRDLRGLSGRGGFKPLRIEREGLEMELLLCHAVRHAVFCAGRLLNNSASDHIVDLSGLLIDDESAEHPMDCVSCNSRLAKGLDAKVLLRFDDVLVRGQSIPWVRLYINTEPPTSDAPVARRIVTRNGKFVSVSTETPQEFAFRNVPLSK